MSPPDLMALLCCTSADDWADFGAALEESRVEVLRTADPEHTRELACLDCFALIIVDLDGNSQWPSLLRALQQQAPGAVLVVYSRLPDERLWIEALEAGAFDYICKPFYRRDLQWVLENALQARVKRPACRPVTAEVRDAVSKSDCRAG